MPRKRLSGHIAVVAGPHAAPAQLPRATAVPAQAGPPLTGQRAPLLHRQLAAWWPLMSAPAEYEEEAAFYQQALLDACERSRQTLLDLGSGGGNNALLTAAVFQPRLIPFDHSDLEPGSYELFAASRPV